MQTDDAVSALFATHDEAERAGAVLATLRPMRLDMHPLATAGSMAAEPASV